MSNVRKRKVTGRDYQEENVGSRRHVERLQQKSNCPAQCLKALFCAVVVIAVVAAVGYYKSPFVALSTTDFSKHVKLEGKLEVNKKLSQGTK